MEPTAAAAQRIFKEFDSYDFANDQAFQQGIKSIPNHEDTQVQSKAKHFYYCRTRDEFDYEAYLQWKTEQSGGEQPDGVGEASMVPGAPYSAPFAEVVRKILNNEPFDDIRQIPEQLNENPPSVSTAKAPRKPWEQD
ncbi:hypothetical protein DL89DRAFT_267542 [Linderina pennispora]|uniref:Uncharacterized protein n=1 Tax=Linderina pennispora TaxID=61395 RepID=A0A1Y1WAX3_9FUNG|nr:uncharacterized protein DL89DRAFT_267542 [Linderina pennispora]ORX70314.1 hypothetical protein DL89DRAFT_267542 [Linderina pennispora]